MSKFDQRINAANVTEDDAYEILKATAGGFTTEFPNALDFILKDACAEQDEKQLDPAAAAGDC